MKLSTDNEYVRALKLGGEKLVIIVYGAKWYGIRFWALSLNLWRQPQDVLTVSLRQLVSEYPSQIVCYTVDIDDMLVLTQCSSVSCWYPVSQCGIQWWRATVDCIGCSVLVLVYENVASFFLFLALIRPRHNPRGHRSSSTDSGGEIFSESFVNRQCSGRFNFPGFLHPSPGLQLPDYSTL